MTYETRQEMTTMAESIQAGDGSGWDTSALYQLTSLMKILELLSLDERKLASKKTWRQIFQRGFNNRELLFEQ